MSEASDRLEAIVAAIPYARFLGARMTLAGDEMTAILPYAEHLIGNPMLPALHGGVLGAFMEMTAVAQLTLVQQSTAPRSGSGPKVGLAQPRPIGVTVDYLRSGRPVDTFARAQVQRLGRRIANVHVEAWQEARSGPIALLHGRFLVAAQDATETERP